MVSNRVSLNQYLRRLAAMDKELLFDDIDDVADGMIPDSQIVKIIGEIESAKGNIDSSEEGENQYKLVAIC